jgi:3'-5' exoribonuclease
MKYIETLKEGERISDIYLCKHKQALVTKNGKPYETIILQDKTGTLDAKIWEPNSAGIDDFDVMDYIEVMADITSFQGALQANVKRVRKVSEGEYDPQDFLPTSEQNIEEMYKEFVSYIDKVKNPYLNKLLKSFYVEDAELIKKFKFHSAAKSVHHGFVGGLLEHSLSVTKLCDYYAQTYTVLNRDLLLTAAMLHDVGKTWELSAFPVNDYTDDGQLLGHIMIGAEEISYRIRGMEGFPAKLASELKHCILAHHGELEYGSPKKPALAEAVALNLADNTDARMKTIKEMFNSAGDNNGWLGYNRLFESNFRKSTNYND